MQYNQKFGMVGVARIELATPTMSTQGIAPKGADLRHFQSCDYPIISGTGRESPPLSPELHRTTQGRVS